MKSWWPLLVCFLCSGLVVLFACGGNGNGVCPDSDGDGYADQACGGDDCNDNDPTIYPGADDTCEDGIDRDCDGLDCSDCVDLIEEYSLILCDQCEDWFDFCDCVEEDRYYDCESDPITCIFDCEDASPGNEEECECNIAGLVYNEGTEECEALDPECNEDVIEVLQGMIDDFVCPEYTPCG